MQCKELSKAASYSQETLFKLQPYIVQEKTEPPSLTICKKKKKKSWVCFKISHRKEADKMKASSIANESTKLLW